MMIRFETDGMRSASACVLALFAFMAAVGPARAEVCHDLDEQRAAYTVCTIEAGSGDLRLYLHDGAGKPYATFAQLADALAQTRKTLVFAMNAGMFEENLSPVGLYIEGGETKRQANTRDGPGNFT